jgi:hypothetical protein
MPSIFTWIPRRSGRVSGREVGYPCAGPHPTAAAGRFGKTQKCTFDYARMGTTDLYAAMDVRTGIVITSLSQTHATPRIF